jgi:hypothetical protein
MIARKIIYKGNLGQNELELVFDISRKIEITGEIRLDLKNIELNLEGDASMIKLIEHQIERKLGDLIQGKEITAIPYKMYEGLRII